MILSVPLTMIVQCLFEQFRETEWIALLLSDYKQEKKETKMAKMTMHQELEMLREEVEELKKEKEAQEKREKEEALKTEKAREKKQKEAEEKAKEIMESIEEGTTDAKEVFNDLLKTIRKDYENLSPTSAIVLFALGAAFGHALSSK